MENLPNLNVLAVDDEPGIRALYARALAGKVRQSPGQNADDAAGAAAPSPIEPPKYQLHVATSGLEAISLVENLLKQGIHIAAGFFDVRMPGGIDGIETIRRLRAIDPMILCTVVTAYGQDRLDEINQIFAPDHLDEWDYLNKPFNVGEIIQKARNTVSSWNRRRAEERQMTEMRRVMTELAELNRTLDHKVAERTTQLTYSNDELATANVELQIALERLRQTQVQLVQNAKLASLGQLAAGVAHEINNPIGFVNSNLDTLRRYTERLVEYLTSLEDWARNDHQAGERIDELRRAKKVNQVLADMPNIISQSAEGTARVQQIVTDLRTFARIDQETMGLTDLNDTIRCALNLISTRMPPDVSVTANYGNIPNVQCQSMEISQACMNLLLNAVEAVKPGGTLTITTAMTATGVLLKFADDGCGIAREHLDRVIDPFFTTKAAGAGVGLGLTVAYNIIKRHQGELTVISELDQGTTVSVLLPTITVTSASPELLTARSY